MKKSRMILGVLATVISGVVAFQAFYDALLFDALENNGGLSGNAGMILAACLLVGGIVAIAARKTRIGVMITSGFFFIGSAIGFINVIIDSVGTFKTLLVWSFLALAFAGIFFVDGIIQKK